MKLTFEKVGYRYPKGRESVFEDFSYEFEAGISILKGYSGCGKSTLLRLGAGLLSPSQGVVRSDSKYRAGSSAYLRREVGFVFQQLNLLPLASVRRNAVLAARFGGASVKKIDKWLDVLGIADLAKCRPQELSGGQQQRAALGRALVKEPRLLLLDEPTSGLDDKNTEIIKHVVANELPSGTTCIIATHDHRLLSLTNAILDFNTGLPSSEHPASVD